MKKVSLLLLLFSIFFNFAKANLSVEFVGDTTKIWDSNFSFYCCAVLFPIVNISEDTIYITECDTLDVCTCGCTYTMCTSIIGLKAGTYTAVITHEWKYHHPMNGQEIYIDNKTSGGSITFTKIDPAHLSYNLVSYQSGCLSNVDDRNFNSIPYNHAIIINYPNPFNPSTIIQYTIPYTAHVRLSIFDNLGKEVATLIDQKKSMGTYEYIFQPNNLSNGTYYCRLIYGDQMITSKFVLLK